MSQDSRAWEYKGVLGVETLSHQVNDLTGMVPCAGIINMSDDLIKGNIIQGQFRKISGHGI